MNCPSPSRSLTPGPIAISTSWRDVERLPRRGDIWTTDAGISVLVISSTVYNEIPREPAVVVPVFDAEPDTGFGGDG